MTDGKRPEERESRQALPKRQGSGKSRAAAGGRWVLTVTDRSGGYTAPRAHSTPGTAQFTSKLYTVQAVLQMA